MTTPVLLLLSRADRVLQDAGIRWPDEAKLDWLNEAQRVIVGLRPNANAVNASIRLAGGTKQKLPADANILLDVVRNMGADGNTPGRVIRIVTRESLDSQDANWHVGTPAPVVAHYIYNPNDPKTYYVYPPQPTIASQIEIVYSAFPADCTLVGNIGLDDVYAAPLLEYVLYRAFTEDAEVSGAAGRASTHASMFTQLLTGQGNATAPGANLAPLNTAGATG